MKTIEISKNQTVLHLFQQKNSIQIFQLNQLTEIQFKAMNNIEGPLLSRIYHKINRKNLCLIKWFSSLMSLFMKKVK